MLAVRRLLAYWVDWMLFALWVAAVLGVVLLTQGGDPRWTDDPWRSQGLGALLTTAPLLLYFALCERTARGATVGKRLLGLRVTTRAGDRLSFARALGRAAVKLLPWELGHTAAHQLLAAGLGEREPPAWAFALSYGSMALALVWVVALFVGSGRAPHDVAAGTRVARA